MENFTWRPPPPGPWYQNSPTVHQLGQLASDKQFTDQSNNKCQIGNPTWGRNPRKVSVVSQPAEYTADPVPHYDA